MARVALEKLPDRRERERQEDPVGFGEVERALDRPLRAAPVAERLARDGVEQRGVDRRPRRVKRAHRALDDRCERVDRRLGVVLGEVHRGGGDPHPCSVALVGGHGFERGPHRGRLPHADLRLQESAAQLDVQRVRAGQGGLRPLRPAERGERLVGPSPPQGQQSSRAVEDERGRRLSATERALRPLEPALAVLQAALAHQEVPAHGERRSGHRIAGPPVGLGQRHRLLGEREGLRGGPSAEHDSQREVPQARDLDVWAPAAARELERVLEVTLRVAGPQRPQLGDAQVHQRDRSIVVAQRALAAGARLGDRREGRLDGPGLVERGAHVAALPRHEEGDRGQPQLEEPSPVVRHRLGRLLGRGDVRAGVVEETVEGASVGVRERQLGVRRRLGRERRQQRRERRSAAVEDEAQLVVGEQAGGVRPVLRRRARA